MNQRIGRLFRRARPPLAEASAPAPDASPAPAATTAAEGLAAPFRVHTFRRIWFASLACNLGTMVQGVGVAWAMTQMTSSADKVALVQTALALPVVLIAMLAGAFADVHDRRVVALVSLCIALAGATLLTLLAALGLLTPDLLLLLCFAVGCGTALMGPAWQTSVVEQVPAPAVPAAVALNSINYNIARSVGPAIGGIVVATAGTVAAFAVNAIAYLPLMVVLYRWNRQMPRASLPPEQLTRAVISGVRYVAHSPVIRILLVRSLVFGALGSVMLALMPLVASDLLRSGAGTFGLLFSALGVGAVLGALNITELRRRYDAEQALRGCVLLLGAALAVLALSRWTWLSAFALLVAGAAWSVGWTLFNIGVQLSVPGWVIGRALAAYSGASMGGIGLGGAVWGHLAEETGVQVALLTAAALVLLSPVIGRWLPVPPIRIEDPAPPELADPEVRLPLQGDEGPLVVEIEYRVLAPRLPEFHEVMQQVQRSRQRNGAYAWSLAQDIAEPELWTERFRCPTWHDYLRHRHRPTPSERQLQQQALDFHIGSDKARVRRMLVQSPDAR